MAAAQQKKKAGGVVNSQRNNFKPWKKGLEPSVRAAQEDLRMARKFVKHSKERQYEIARARLVRRNKKAGRSEEIWGADIAWEANERFRVTRAKPDGATVKSREDNILTKA